MDMGAEAAPRGSGHLVLRQGVGWARWHLGGLSWFWAEHSPGTWELLGRSDAQREQRAPEVTSG